MRAFLLAAVTLLAGCAAPAPPSADPAADAAPTTLPWALLGCDYVVAWSPADPAKLQARLPDGFAVARGALGGVLPAPTTALGTEAFVCDEGTTLDGTVAHMAYGSFWFAVVPPDEHAVDGVDQYYWKEDMLVPDAARFDLFSSLGLSVRGGEATVEDAPVPDGAEATLQLDGVGLVRMTMTTSREATLDGAAFVEFTPSADGGLAVWRANYTWDEPARAGGRGTVAWPAGSWAADAVGATTAPADFHAGTWSFEGTVTLPRRP